jgi:hypothetical protein
MLCADGRRLADQLTVARESATKASEVMKDSSIPFATRVDRRNRAVAALSDARAAIKEHRAVCTLCLKINF